MMHDRLETLIEHWCNGSLSVEDTQELNASLRSSAEARQAFQEAASLHGLLHAAANSLAIDTAARQSFAPLSTAQSLTPAYFGWRNMIGVVVGMAMGIVGVSAVWALASPSLVAVSIAIATLNHASFENSLDKITRGFPTESGTWGGDEVEIVKRGDTASGTHALRFVTAMSDRPGPTSNAIACDTFQIVDLRNLEHVRQKTDDMVLELSAQFLDERPQNRNPSVTFFCQIYLFRGDFKKVYEHWPEAISDATSSGSAEVTTLGDSGWQGITARCLVPDHADFAVVHLAARPNLRVPVPEGLFVDQVELIAKTQPVLRSVMDVRSNRC